jgi:hypothetical protein
MKNSSIIQKIKVYTLVGVFLLPTFGIGQYGRKYEGPDDPAGDQAAVRSGQFNGNRMYFLLNNNTSICDTGHGQAIWNKWPDIYTGFTLMHGVNAIMAARVYIKGDSTPVTDINEIQSRDDLTILHFAQQGWRGRTDCDPTGLIEWGMKPVMGYINPLSETMAMSNRPESWPPNGWPARGDELKWPGEWNGRFGRGVIKSDLEVFYVNNDAHDQEYLGPEDSVKYYPRPGIKIGDKNPNVTIQKGLPWGGIGLRLEARAFQWNNPQARDAAFFEYTIANISEYNLPEMCFGFYLHPWIGEDQGMVGDDYLYFDNLLDMSYNWDSNGIGEGGIPTGAFGMAYLESPANPFDGNDNDDDGLIDEERDNVAEKLIGPYDGIADLFKFLNFYNYTEDMLHDHWDADEDQDWRDGNDLNNNDKYDFGEDPGDDVGLDGVGPGELNYTVPDEGECNHKPDFVEGLGCEPNFAFTDVSESDMLGLTSFHTYDHESEPRIHTDDVRIWEYFSDASYDEFQDQLGEWVNLFATGIFPLYKGRTERISMGLVASYDPVEGLNSSRHIAPALYRKKEIIQIIYERDYRFAQPPLMPTLKATAGDGKVILTWDNVAEYYTREPLLRNANDFEGYKLFKSTDKKFLDPVKITDGYGTPTFMSPIFQCDLVNDINGFADFGLINGTAFYLGSNNGIQHYFVDENVENGVTYYYALVAYDHGIPEIGNGVPPSENNVIVELDEAEEIRAFGRNVQIVTPHQAAAGYVPPQIEILQQTWPPSTGTVIPKILGPQELDENHIYKVKFTVDTIQVVISNTWYVKYTTNGYQVYDVTDGNQLVLSKIRDTEEHTPNTAPHSIYIDSLRSYSLAPNELFETDAFEGLGLNMQLNTFYAPPGELDYEATGWRVGNLSGNIAMNITLVSDDLQNFPWEYEIIFGDPGMYTGITTAVTTIRDEIHQKPNKDLFIAQQEFNFHIINKNFADSLGNYEKLDLMAFDADSSGVFELENDRVFAGVLNTRNRWYKTLFIIDFEEGSEMPQPNDIYRMTFKRPFFVTDSLTFKILPQCKKDLQALKTKMDSIQVVPNPYVATNHMEPSVANYFLNQRRRILFTHVPARCEIKIFTVSGILVDEIDVENAVDNGAAFWDLLTKEGLEISAGVYVYYVKAKETDDVKIGKFSIIK